MVIQLLIRITAVTMFFAITQHTNIIQAQSIRYIEMGLDVSLRPAIGLNFGYYNPSAPQYSISYISAYVLGIDGLQGEGKDYSDVINRGSYPNDVREEGYDYDHIGIRLGLNTAENTVLYGVLGLRRAYFVQNRYDRTNILSNDGEYHIRYADNSKNKIDFGVGGKFFPKTTRHLISFNVEYSIYKSITLSLNYRAPM
jgi:hypothetical protein